MHTALFVAAPLSAKHKDWSDFLDYVEGKIQPSKYALRIAENVWLLNLQESVAPFGWLVSLAEKHGVSYGILPFERAPEWLPVGFDPTSILIQNERP